MLRTRSILLELAVAPLLGVHRAQADVDTGLRAVHESGYEAAVTEWFPLARTGSVNAQLIPGSCYYQMESGVIDDGRNPVPARAVLLA